MSLVTMQPSSKPKPKNVPEPVIEEPEPVYKTGEKIKWRDSFGPKRAGKVKDYITQANSTYNSYRYEDDTPMNSAGPREYKTPEYASQYLYSTKPPPPPPPQAAQQSTRPGFRSY